MVNVTTRMAVDTMMLKLVLLVVVWLQVANCNVISVNSEEIFTLNGNVYYFSRNQMGTIQEATKACNDANMTLVAIETKEEMMEINKYVIAQNLTLYEFHTSGVRVHHHWLWSSRGRIFGYARWHIGNPCPTEHNMQACAYYVNGWLAEYNCDRTYRFICEGPCEQ